MPKMKSSSGAAKRFKKTANGYKHRQSHRSHILTKKKYKKKKAASSNARRCQE